MVDRAVVCQELYLTLPWLGIFLSLWGPTVIVQMRDEQLKDHPYNENISFVAIFIEECKSRMDIGLTYGGTVFHTLR
jgi:hypothetical protein